MTQVEVELHDDAVSILNKLKNINDTGIELVVPDGAVILENMVNLKLLKTWVEESGKTLHFLTNDQYGQVLLKNMEGVADTSYEEAQYLTPPIKQRKVSLPKLQVPKIGFKPKPTSFAVLGALLIFGYVGLKILFGLPNANINIVVNSQPLTKSISIKVDTAGTTNKEQKILTGETASINVDESMTTKTTGEKIIGEKATGKIKMYNKTDNEKEFKSGTEIIYDKDDNELKYELTDDVSVPARTYTPDPNDPNAGGTYQNGEAAADIQALEIGSKYNITKGSALAIDEQSISNFSANTEEDIDGGKEETLEAVAQEDLDKLQTDVTKIIQDKSLLELEKSLSPGQKIVNGSESTTFSTVDFDKEVGDEAEEVTLKQSATSTALVYNSRDLDELMDKVVQEFIPDGFILSTKERTVNVEVLGNTGTTELNTTKADIQVTLKTFVVPDITEENLMEQIKGKSVSETQKILGSIRNIKTYEFKLSPKIPIFGKVPTDENRIHITIERE